VALIIWPLAFLGLLVFATYLQIAHPADSPPATIAVQGAGWVAVFAHLTWVAARRRPRSPAQSIRVIGLACLLLCTTLGLLVNVADQARAQGPFGDAISGVDLAVLLAIAAYWVIGERRLSAFLERHAAGRQASS
jgi:hypothetical protein